MLAPVPRAKVSVSSWAQALRLLRARSTNLKVALDQVLQAEGQTTVALAQYLPSLGGCAGGSSAPGGCANAGFTHQLITRQRAETATGTVLTNVVPIPNTFTASATLSQNIINFQELDQISINRLMVDESRLTVKDTLRTLELSLANQIVSVVAAERSAEINRIGLRVALEQYELSKQKQDLGAAISLDVVRAKQNAANARASLVNGDEALHQAREALGLTLGIPLEVGVAPEMKMSGIAQDTFRSCQAVDTIDERPDVAASQTALEVAKRNLKNTWYSFIPVLTAQSTLTATTAVNAGYPNPTWSIGAALSVPIFDGGTRVGIMKSQRAAADQAAQQLEGLRLQALIQVEQAQRGIKLADVSFKVALEQRELAAQNDQMTQTLYRLGKATSVELVTASEAHRQAELSQVVAELATVKAHLAALMVLSTCPLSP
jgi:outer membrane protein TolC